MVAWSKSFMAQKRRESLSTLQLGNSHLERQMDGERKARSTFRILPEFPAVRANRSCIDPNGGSGKIDA
jgi:hypothetical protein